MIMMGYGPEITGNDSILEDGVTCISVQFNKAVVHHRIMLNRRYTRCHTCLIGKAILDWSALRELPLPDFVQYASLVGDRAGTA